MDRQILLSPKYITERVNVIRDRQPQEIVVTGKVTDKDGNRLPGVNIIIKGTLSGTITNANGDYTLEVDDPEAVLVFTFIGMFTQEIKVGDQTEINMVMTQDVIGLEEVIAIGYGVQKKTNLTGSISVVETDAIVNRPITDATQILQGVSGLYINQAGGEPGSDDATIRIRGVGTMGSSSKLDPLVLVDGVEYSMNAVNPNDIQSISVLKDAASTSIYGSRAANGVILITTKRGIPGKFSIEYNNYVGFQEATYLPDPVDNSVDFLEAYNTAMVNGSKPSYYPDALIDEFRNNPTSDIYPNTNWMDLMFSRALIHEHNLRASGGSKELTYNFSIGYLNQDGILMGTASEKYTANLRISAQLKVLLWEPFGRMIKISQVLVRQ